MLSREEIELDLGLVEAETWPPRHKMHKYWGRKPANIVSKYVEYFTMPGETVLDPFAGSAVTLVEATRLGRKALGFDINPIAVRLGRCLLHPPNAQDFQRDAAAVVADLRDEVATWFGTSCRHCGTRCEARSFGYVEDRLVDVRFHCESCRKSGSAPPESRDIQLSQAVAPPPANAPDEDIFFGWEMQKLRRRDVRRWSELFTSRNYRIAALLRERILVVSDPLVREWLLITLTASLAQFSRMIADFAGAAGGPSWKINCYWLPDRWQELNPIWYFANRVSKSLAAISDLAGSGALPVGATYDCVDSRRLSLPDRSIDYIFTDPPYGGEGVQYGELSMLWCLWLNERSRLDSEIAFNPYRQFTQQHYDEGIRAAFSEAFRVLRPGRWMTVTFANKDPEVWDGLMRACRATGFRLVTAAPMKRSAPALTETNMRRAPKADLVLSFQRPTPTSFSLPAKDANGHYDIALRVKDIARKLRDCGRPATSHEVFDLVTIDWFSWYYENGERPETVRPTLEVVERLLGADGEERPTRSNQSSSSPK
jgi:16S rRNA G966 N2-methylase RsmD